MKSTNHMFQEESFSRDLGIICNWNYKKTKALAISVFMSFFILSVLRLLTDTPSYGLLFMASQEEPHVQDATAGKINDKLMGGLLLSGLNESSCKSRYESNLYRKPRSVGPPSSYLISRLRKYEALQKKCGPNTNPYKKFVEDIKFGRDTTDSSVCKYVIYNPIKGLGNRMITIGASFLYALLTNRVMFIGDGGDLEDLFCEPFPDVSWWLPSDFPVNSLRTLKPFGAYNRYGNLLENGNFRNSSVPLFVYFYLGFGYNNYEKNFFCNHDQELLQQVPWLILRSDLYFLPSLFLIPSFQEELNNLFPDKESVFHHLGRYLFHPSNSVWGLITRYYDAYLAKSDEILGIQIRIGPYKAPLADQILACALKDNLLPDINRTQPVIKQSNILKRKAVLVTSLLTNHSEQIKNMYWQYATINQETISVHQPSHEEREQFQNQMHDMKALAEVFLLSFSDNLMITAKSTFGYAAQSLGGLRPWILHIPPRGEHVPNPPCRKSLSMEPCYHFAPTFYACPNTSRFRTFNHVPYLQICEDFQGLKLFD